jgi:regulator of protease activity HflC (stomatin/prohibitin superfamily)
MELGIILGLAILVCLLILVCVRIVPQAQAFVITRLGQFKTTWSNGIHFHIPIIDKIFTKVDMREQVCDYRPQPVITRDNVKLEIGTILFYQVTDPKNFAFGVSDPPKAIEAMTATTLRNIIGEMEFDETLTSRDSINNRMRVYIDEATSPWGVKVVRVELKEIMASSSVQEAMEQQMAAERSKRAQVLQAQGLKEAAILSAQAQRETAILEAEGRAQAILAIQKATAEGIQLIKKAEADEMVFKLNSLETLKEIANGTATTIFIPSELQGMVGNASVLSETFSVLKK